MQRSKPKTKRPHSDYADYFNKYPAVCRSLVTKAEKIFFNPQQIFPSLDLQFPGKLMSIQELSSLKGPKNKVADRHKHTVRKTQALISPNTDVSGEFY